jgi:hypothetical protein
MPCLSSAFLVLVYEAIDWFFGINGLTLEFSRCVSSRLEWFVKCFL